MKQKHLSGMLALALLLASCGGHGNSPAPPVPKTASKTVRVPFTVLVPKAPVSASTGRTPKYISSATKSVAVEVDERNAPQPLTFAFNVTATSPNCSATASGTLCTEQIDAPLDTVVITVTAYDALLNASGAPQGNQLSRGQVYQTITEGAANDIKVTMNGTPSSARITLDNASPPQGTQSTTAVHLDVRDAGGYSIVGTYSEPVYFPCDPQQHYQYSLSVNINGQGGAWISSSTDTVTLQYVGYGLEATTLTACPVQSTSTILGSVQFTPQATFGTEMPVDASLDNATALSTNSGIEFTEPSKSRVASLAPNATQPLYYPIPSGAQPLRLDGVNGQYFTLSNDKIGEFSQYSGGIVEHALPTANAGLYAIGGQWYYDFTIWFTEHNTGKLGAMGTIGSSSGGITEYATGFRNSAPAGMSYGGGGFYFCDPGANAIGQVNPGTGSAPVITQYPLPTAAAQPLEITFDYPSQHGWFTEEAASKVGSIDSNGVIKEYPSAGVPVAITDANGKYVFVLTSAHNLERYDITSGASVTITPPSSSNGPVLGLASAFNSIILLRGNGTTGALQYYYY